MAETTATSDTSGSTRIARIAAAASTNATLVSPNKGNLYGVFIFATSVPATGSTTVFLKIYDKTTAPVVGTDTPIFTVPVISTPTLAGAAQFSLDEGIPFFNGLAYAITGGVADSDTTAVAANAIHGSLFYKS